MTCGSRDLTGFEVIKGEEPELLSGLRRTFCLRLRIAPHRQLRIVPRTRRQRDKTVVQHTRYRPTGFRSARAKLGCRDRSPAQRERRLIERLLLLDMELIYARFTLACTKWRGATGDCNRPCVEIVVDVEIFVQRLHEDRLMAQFSTFHVL